MKFYNYQTCLLLLYKQKKGDKGWVGRNWALAEYEMSITAAFLESSATFMHAFLIVTALLTNIHIHGVHSYRPPY